MNRIPPSQRIQQAIRELLESGLEGDANVLDQFLYLGAQRFVQEVVEQEVEDFLGRGHYQHRKVLLHLALGNQESYDIWLDFLRDMVRRGLKTPLTITTDGAPGLIKAVEAMWPKSLRIRCWAHKARNILNKVPEAARAEIKAYLGTIREAPTPEAGKKAAEVIESYPSNILRPSKV